MEKAIMATNRDLRPRPKPVDEWQRRFGWPTGSRKDKRRDDLILEWMWATTMYIWGDRYKSAEEAAKIQKVQERRRIWRTYEDEEWLITEANLLQEGSDKDEGEVDSDIQEGEDEDDEDEAWKEGTKSDEAGMAS